MMKNKFLILAISLSLFSCGTSNRNVNEEQDFIIAIKFMYSNSYGVQIDDVSFWQNKEEHAKLELFTNNSENFVRRIKSFPKGNYLKFEFMKYAFIVKHSNVTDTIYADLDLDTWMIKNNGVQEFYNDEKKEFTEDLRTRYGFFKSCW